MTMAENESLHSGPVDELHILLALTVVSGSVAQLALGRHGITEDSIRTRVLCQGRRCVSVPTFEIEQFLIAAHGQATASGHHYIGTEHLLLQLLEPVYLGVGDFLASLHVESKKIRREIHEILGSGSQEER